MNISNLTNWIKLSPKYVIPIASLSSLLLFLPAKALSVFGANTLVDKHRMWIGLVCLSSYALLITHFAFWLKDFSIRRIKSKRSRKQTLDSLKNLTPEEKTILTDYILLQTKSQQLSVQSGVTNGLEHAGIVYRSASLGSAFGGFAYNIQPWAWEELNDNPELLEPIITQRREEIEAKNQRKGNRY